MKNFLFSFLLLLLFSPTHLTSQSNIATNISFMESAIITENGLLAIPSTTLEVQPHH